MERCMHTRYEYPTTYAHEISRNGLLPETREARLDALPVVERGPGVNVERHFLRVVRVRLARVEVDHVANLGSASVHDPVVAVERRGVTVGQLRVSFRPALIAILTRT